ncbi:MAG: tRNA preQ1(34) S-adenosylmethionine ribosyltransferase-isomerase QueA [Patescibacteria group bacterium]
MNEKRFKKSLKTYDYSLKKELIAQDPARPRDSARLLIARRSGGEAVYSTFKNICEYLPANALVVMNETKVVPARFLVRKKTGGAIKLLYLSHSAKEIRALSPKRLKDGTILLCGKSGHLLVKKEIGGEYVLRPSFPAKNIFRYLDNLGETPLPPYLSHSSLTEKGKRMYYQAVFAKKKGSAAAPTASLHFTGRLLRKIRAKGNKIVRLTLHVGLGTFGPLNLENLEKNRLHEEYYEIPENTVREISKAKKEKRPIIAVGTTVVRALESAWGKKGIKFKGKTKLFIKEGYQLRVVDGLITNFHVPMSSLLMLVSAFCGRRRLLGLYRKAIRRKFRFFSFGDGMMLLP